MTGAFTAYTFVVPVLDPTQKAEADRLPPMDRRVLVVAGELFVCAHWRRG
jgi:hypothetical protein